MKLEEYKYYHIYHRGANEQNIYFEPEDYETFIKRYLYYLFLAADTLAYCLLPNHFHFLIHVRPVNEQLNLFNRYKSKYEEGTFHGDRHNAFKPYSASSQIGHLINSYTKHINTKYERSGVLFDGKFKRIEIESQDYLNYLICYIHRNPIHHGFSDDYISYPHSSYNRLLNNRKSFLNRILIMKYLGGEENFVAAHKEVLIELEEKYKLEY
ncbi:MAG: hypothetical protein JJU37_10580 [Balneolaceae bacterium]|nr:hypothetical protein [Balneolaceae bacterium]